MGKKRSRSNVPKNIASGPGERIETTVLKRRKRIETVHADKVRKNQQNRRKKGPKSSTQQKRELRKQVFRNARDFVNNFKRREAEKRVVARRQKEARRPAAAEARGAAAAAAEGSIVFAIRAKGDDIPLACKRMLARWGMRRMHEARLLAISDAVLRDLHALRDFVRWGYPSTAHIGHLLRTRAYLYNDAGMRVPLSGNTQIEERLGDHGVLCIEDIEHALSHRGENFQRCLDVLAPVRLDPPERDQAELDRRARERKTVIGAGSFTAYLVTAMPDLPVPKEGAAGGAAPLGRRRALASDNTAKRWKGVRKPGKGAKA